MIDELLNHVEVLLFNFEGFYVTLPSLSFQKPSWEKAAKIIKERYFNFYCACLIPRNCTLESLPCHLLCLIGNYLSITILI